MTTNQFLTRPEGRIGFDLQGPPDAPLVLCVPGMGELRSAYRFTVPALLAAGYRVATMDLRGHGDSDAGFERLEDVATASDIVALIDDVGAPAVVVGNSMAAAAGVIAAADRSDLVRGLVLLGPFVRDAPTNPTLKVLMRVVFWRPWGPAAWRAYHRSLFPGRRPADLAEHQARIKAAMARPGYWKAFQRLVRQLTHAPAEARLPEVHTPTLVVMGTKDPDFKDPVAEAAFIAQALDGESVLVEGAGHYPMTQYPDVVNSAILEFLARVAPVPARG